MNLLGHLFHHEPPPVAVDLLHWDGSLSVGNGLLDNEHRAIAAILNALYAHSRDHRLPLDVARLCVRLDQTLRVHFANEEEVLARHRCPSLARHHEAHTDILARLTALEAGLPVRATSETEAALTDLVRHILLYHVLVEDMDLRDFLRE